MTNINSFQAGDSIQIVFHTTSLSVPMPDVIPLPEEMRSGQELQFDTNEIPAPEIKPEVDNAVKSRSSSPISKVSFLLKKLGIVIFN